jgi:hypothetical protein
MPKTLDTQNLLIRLLENDVQFVLIGGFAAVVHGSSIITQDLDICCPFNKDNIQKLLASVDDLHPQHRSGTKRLPMEKNPEDVLKYKNLYLETDWGMLKKLSYSF